MKVLFVKTAKIGLLFYFTKQKCYTNFFFIDLLLNGSMDYVLDGWINDQSRSFFKGEVVL